MKSFYILLIIFTTGNRARAQQELTLQQCLETGLKNNPDFQLRQLDILSAETTYRNPALEYLPTVSLSGNHSYSIGSVIDPATNTRVSSKIQSDNFSLNANMNILDFNVFTTARRNKLAALKAGADKDAIAAEYALSLLDNYINVLYSQELLKIQKNQFENAKFNLNRVTKEVELGSRPKSDLYDMQVSYTQEEAAIIQTEQLLYNQKLALLQLINYTGVSPDDITLQHLPYAEIELKSKEDIMQQTLANHPAIKAATFGQQVAQKAVTIQKNNYLPVISAFYSYSSFYYLPLNQPGAAPVAPFWTQLNDNKNHYVGLQLSIPVFNGLKTRRDVQLAKIAYQKSTVTLEKEQIKLRQQIEQETAKQQQNVTLTGKLEESKGFAEKSFETTQAKFSSGLVDAIVFTASKNQLLTAEYNLLKAKVTTAYATIKLQFLQYNSFK
ncbi:MAG: TolC family protein [Bacteroidota bacterium]